MKSKQVKYEEAVTRNISKSLGKEKYNVPVDANAEQVEKMFDKVKSAMGIRANDTKFNDRIKTRLGL